MAPPVPPTKRTPAPPHTVYVLEDEAGRIRYVGVTNNPSRRLGQHVRESRTSNTYRANWIRSMTDAGNSPTLRVVETGVSDWVEAERRWVAKCRNEGCDLVNGNDGGMDFPERIRSRGLAHPNTRFCLRKLGIDLNMIKRGEARGHLASGAAERFKVTVERVRASMRRNRKLGRLDIVEQRFAEYVARKGWVVRG